MTVSAAGNGRIVERRPAPDVQPEQDSSSTSRHDRVEERDTESTKQARDGAKATTEPPPGGTSGTSVPPEDPPAEEPPASDPPEDDRGVVDKGLDKAKDVAGDAVDYAKDVVVRFQWGRVFK